MSSQKEISTTSFSNNEPIVLNGLTGQFTDSSNDINMVVAGMIASCNRQEEAGITQVCQWTSSSPMRGLISTRPQMGRTNHSAKGLLCILVREIEVYLLANNAFIPEPLSRHFIPFSHISNSKVMVVSSSEEMNEWTWETVAPHHEGE